MADAAFRDNLHDDALKFLAELYTADSAYREAQVNFLFHVYPNLTSFLTINHSICYTVNTHTLSELGYCFEIIAYFLIYFFMKHLVFQFHNILFLICGYLLNHFKRAQANIKGLTKLRSPLCLGVGIHFSYHCVS